MSKELVSRYIEAEQDFFRTGQVDFLDDFLSPDFQRISAGELSNREDRRQELPMYRAAFPDVQIIIEDMVADGDKVAVRLTAHGTHKGKFMGIPPTGKQWTFTEIRIARVAEGKIVEQWEEWSQMGMMQQIGVLPTE
jgi:steroid delta-isomerase-like uncharacterized protein